MADKVTCPECGGFGYHENGTPDGRDCGTCDGDGTCSPEAAAAYVDLHSQ
jgi:DnaJ-class molecular chaperone